MRLLRLAVGSEPCVLCYHAVTDGWDDELAVRPAAFESQIRAALRSGYRPAGLEDVVAGARRSLHVTFDDAFANIRHSLDLLVSLGVPATVFACSDLAEDGRALGVGDLGGSRAAPAGEGATMTWSELRELAEQGIDVGSHTRSHPHLPDVTDDDLRRELVDSRARIEDELGRPCRYLAYPFGDHDARVCDAARAAGYRAAFAQASRMERANPYAFQRVSVYRSDSPWRVTLKMSRIGRMGAALKLRRD